MTGTFTVDADGAIAADRSERHSRHLQADRAGRQCEQLIETASVGCELRHLLSGDDIALFAAVCLHSDGVCLHRDLLLGAPELQLEVNASTVTYVKGDAGLLSQFETRGRGF